jgi:coenzyme F420 hydrogenase subunit beta
LSERPKLFEHLFKEVIKENRCSLCGACLASCPDEGIIEIRNEKPAISGKCMLCGICYYQCPAANPPTSDLEEKIFGRKRGNEDEAGLGVFRAIYSARATKEEIREVAQDGGVVTALLACALRKTMIDAAVVVGVEENKPWMPRPMVAIDFQDLLKSSGTKYVSAPLLIGLREAVANFSMQKVALVGTPCQVRAVRNMQYAPRGCLKLGDAVAFTIGLFCWESFYYSRLMEGYLQKEKDIDPTEVTKFSIEKGKLRLFKEEDLIFEVGVKKIGDLAREACHACLDFTSEYADISVGNQGSPAGWSTVIVRSEAGEKLFRVAREKGYIECRPMKEKGMDKLVKLARSKRRSAGSPE